MDSARIRSDATEAHVAMVQALAAGTDPPAGQVERLRTALAGHIETLVAVVRDDHAEDRPGRMSGIVGQTLAVAADVLALPSRGGLLDLAALPPLARFLLLMAEEPDLFADSSEIAYLEDADAL